jgi:hypothetical protein
MVEDATRTISVGRRHVETLSEFFYPLKDLLFLVLKIRILANTLIIYYFVDHRFRTSN